MGFAVVEPILITSQFVLPPALFLYIPIYRPYWRHIYVRRRIWPLAHIAVAAAFTLKELVLFLWIYFNPLKTGLQAHETRYTRRNLPWSGRTFLTLYYLNIPKRTDSDWGVCSWPWQLFVLEKAEHPLFVNINRCTSITVKNTFGWSAVAFFACEVIQSTFCNVMCG